MTLKTEMTDYIKEGKFYLYQKTYPKSHWCNSPELWSYVKKEKVSDDCTIVIKVNVTDARYRLILVPEGTKYYNIHPSSDLYNEGLKQSLIIAADINKKLAKYGIVCQIEFAGNNSMDQLGKYITLGNNKEPHMPHVHLILRCPRDFFLELDGGVKLPYKGPNPGELFNMRKGKEKWSNIIEKKGMLAQEAKENNVKRFASWLKKIFD